MDFALWIIITFAFLALLAHETKLPSLQQSTAGNMEKFTIAGAGPLKERGVFGSGLTEKEASVCKLNPYHTQKKLRGFECGVCRVYGIEWKSGECGARLLTQHRHTHACGWEGDFRFQINLKIMRSIYQFILDSNIVAFRFDFIFKLSNE